MNATLERAGLIAALALAACEGRGQGERLHPARLAAVSAPSPDPDGYCSDLGNHRVCWSASCPGRACVRDRPLPAVIGARARDYRCTGASNARQCEPRAARASPFHCRAGRCIQEQPRLPDDGDWECADLEGAVLCRGGNEPAAVARPRVDPGWSCGARRGKSSERLCLDLDPDLPSAAGDYTCHFQMDGARMRRICERSEAPHLGDGCMHPDVCPAGSDCISGVCLPSSIAPNCWGDGDCWLGQCNYGSCSPENP